jgi:hypothetical protein
MIARPLMIACGVAAMLAGAGLAGCGKTGQLERPAPLFGERAKAEYDAQKRKEAADHAAAERARAASTVTTPDDAASQPLTQAPYAPAIPGRSDPFGPGPQGATPGPGTANDR